MLSPDYDCELTLLGDNPSLNEEDITGGENSGIENAPIFTGDVVEALGSGRFPQRALYGRILETSDGSPIKSPKLYINTNAPFSGIVCGVQGSGKSHSTSVLIESCLICDRRLGTLPEPLSALLFHFDTAAGCGNVPPCEAAHIASLNRARGGDAMPPDVTVLVLPNNLQKMREVYAGLPKVRVEPLHFAPDDLSGERLLAMMRVDQDQHVPLYMEYVMSILRSMPVFSYSEFRQQLEQKKFSPAQKSMLNLRLDILDSCLQGGDTSNRVSNHFKRGQLTIIDLSSPFMDGASACSFFDIILGLFIEARTDTKGKLVVLDEAHKYLDQGGSSSRFTESLLSVIRQQRHLGTRILISTQEPTIVPSSFLDLCSIVIAHRFSSPKWLHHLKEHIAVVESQWSSKMIALRTGEAMIFSPSGLTLAQVPGTATEDEFVGKVAPLNGGYLKVRSRERITRDGGRSQLAMESNLNEVRLGMLNLGLSSVSSGIRSPSSVERATNDRPGRSQASSRPSPYPVNAKPKSNNQRPQPSKFVTGTARSNSPAATPERTLFPKQGVSNEGLPGNPINVNGATQRFQPSSGWKGPPLPSEIGFKELKDVMQQLKALGHLCPNWTLVAQWMSKLHPGVVKTRFKPYLHEAAAAGVVIICKGEKVQLAVRGTF